MVIPSEKEKEEMLKMFYDGISIKEIAKNYNVSYTTAWKYSSGKAYGYNSPADYRRKKKIQALQKMGFKKYSEKIEKNIHPD